MVYTGLEDLNDTGFRSLISFPTLDFAWFWELILLAIFIILAGSTYFSEQNRTGRGNLLSSIGSAGIILIILSTLVRFLGMISKDMLVINVVLGAIFIAIWLITER